MEHPRRHARTRRDARGWRGQGNAGRNGPRDRSRPRDRSVRPHHVRRRAPCALSLRPGRLPVLADCRRSAGRLRCRRGGAGRSGRARRLRPYLEGPGRDCPRARVKWGRRSFFEDTPMTPDPISRDAAWALLTEWTQSESLRKHALAVEAAVRGYARKFGEDEQGWGVVALLHDFDYERYPDAEHHPFEGVAVLKGLGYPE